ncbi:MAG TPA: heme-binding protein [Ramlibacter sp.]|nr:heme-binding protein [Ramlibacter sp.]
MDSITLAAANRIIETGLRIARERQLKPMTFCVLDGGGHLVSAQREDDSSLMRFEIAMGKAWSSLALGHSTRFMEEKMAKNRPHFLDSLAAASGGKFVPCMGGVLVRNAAGKVIGALGVTGDSGENDEAVGVEAIQACGLQADLS